MFTLSKLPNAEDDSSPASNNGSSDNSNHSVTTSSAVSGSDPSAFGASAESAVTASGPTAWNLELDLPMIEEDMQVIDTIDQSYWNGKFVPPPPRPPFLEESIAPDGLTTCDLCSWAWQDKGTLSLDGAISMFKSAYEDIWVASWLNRGNFLPRRYQGVQLDIHAGRSLTHIGSTRCHNNDSFS